MPKIYSIITISIFCLLCVSQVFTQNRQAVSAAEVTGTFEAKGGNEFKILALGKGKLRVAFSGIYEYDSPQYGKMANTGEADGTAIIDGETALFTLTDFEECKITMKFLTLGKLEVRQEGDCGFGLNVSANGLYKKVSGEKPKF